MNPKNIYLSFAVLQKHALSIMVQDTIISMDKPCAEAPSFNAEGITLDLDTMLKRLPGDIILKETLPSLPGTYQCRWKTSTALAFAWGRTFMS